MQDTENHYNCSKFVNHANVNKRLKEVCHGKEKCKLKYDNLLSASQGDQKYFGKSSACGDNAQFFFQIPCTYPDTELAQRQMLGLTVGCIGVFIYLFTIIYFDYIKSVQKTKYVDWDINTISAGDYSVEFDINKDFYEEFEKKYLDKTNPVPEIMQLKLYIKDELERRLTDLPG